MPAKRYYVKSIRDYDSNILWRVYDTKSNGSVARGTKGAGGKPGGYATEAEANRTRDRLEEDG